MPNRSFHAPKSSACFIVIHLLWSDELTTPRRHVLCIICHRTVSISCHSYDSIRFLQPAIQGAALEHSASLMQCYSAASVGAVKDLESTLKWWHAGLGASELYVVKRGEFEVLERRQGINMRVNRKTKGDCFGEVSLMYSCPRSATVAATTTAVVWVLERQIFR